jgi:6,7-dimethyl-8-ribityllumazine synthase
MLFMATIGNQQLFDNSTGTSIYPGACVVIVKTEWNTLVIDELEHGCRDILTQYNVEKITTITVPGAVEIPFAIKAYWNAYQYKANKPCVFIALGCVIKGDTPHFEYVCQSVTQGITQLNTSLPVPVIFGVLTVNTQEQADERLGGIHGHKGKEAAIAAIKMIQMVKSFKA